MMNILMSMTQVLSTDCKTNRLSVLGAKDMEGVFAIAFLQRRPSKVVMNEFDYRQLVDALGDAHPTSSPFARVLVTIRKYQCCLTVRGETKTRCCQ